MGLCDMINIRSIADSMKEPLGGLMEPSHTVKMTFISRLKIDKTAKNEISIVLAKLSFALTLSFVISVLVKWRGNCRFQKSKYKLKMKGVLFLSLINGSKTQGPIP